MPQFIARCLAALGFAPGISALCGFVSVGLVVCALALTVSVHSNNVYASDAAETIAEIEKQLEEAKKLLAEDTANHKETAEKKIEIDRQLATRMEREAEIKDELKLLCEEQDKVKPGTLVACMKKLDN